MNIIPRSLSLVPACPYTRAVSLAIADVEKRLQGRAQRGAHPYASAFLRHYCDTRTVTSDHLRRIVPEYSPRDRFSPAAVEYMAALDMLIASRGERCPSPLPQDTAPRLFPVTALRQRERLDKRTAHRANREVSQEGKVEAKKLRRYQQRLAQAKIDLTFQTPLTVGTWYARQQEQAFFESDIFHMVTAWLPKFTSCRCLDPAWYWEEPLWRLMLDIQAEVKVATEAALDADRQALPNRLVLKS
ncbi:plasmid SOS inhibition protein A [Pantoea sp. GbtcB22]|uniref:plasmid SOS inhibition protein A n=1 Tax=Pantoea sp. GbtcB22 TaxID=2824767 RepID=UPI001C304148|nr:plasmid SOS inhibition protein A [Pantoea sp. GbtcB22]